MTTPRSRTLLLATFVIALATRPVIAVCVGDCDGQHGVTINEVQRAINIYLGTEMLSVCSNADRDGDTQVSISEVQAAVNSFLSDPSSCPTVSEPLATPTPSQPPTVTAHATETPSATVSPSATETAPPTSSGTPAAAATATATNTAAATNTPTSTRTPTRTATRTPTRTVTPTPTTQPTSTTTMTATPAATPTTRPAVCGNGVLEHGETCTSCAADCVVHACTSTGSTVTFAVSFAPPPGESASSVTALVGYRGNVVSLPGSGTGSCQNGSKDGKACSGGSDCPGGQCVLTRSRVKNTPPSSIVGANDLDYAVRVVVTRSNQIAPGKLFTIDFDSCQGAATPTTADFGCNVEGCASSFGSIDGCTCVVASP